MPASRFGGRLRAHAAWFVYIAVAWACTKYLNDRSGLVPKWGEWYPDDQPYVVLQVRALLSGHTAIVPHPAGAGHDYNWGRGGMHQAWGLGLPLLATPFHVLGRLFGAPGFPDDVRFLIFYAATTIALACALRGVSRDERGAPVASAAAAGFVMVFPTFVGMVTSRFLIYEQTIAVGALWDVALLAGVLALLHRCSLARLMVVCVAAGFSIVIRPPLAVYGLTTLVLALLIAWRAGMRPLALIGGFAAYAATASIYCVGNVIRFGAPFNAGYANSISGPLVNRLTRWGLPYAKVPFVTAAKEMFATQFLMDPVTSQIMMGTPPASVQPYLVAERWREYYAPTYNLLVLALWVAALVIVCWRVGAHRLWRRERPLGGEVATVVGVWALPPSIILFVFYARVGQMVTRYSSDMYPAFAAASLCVGMAVVGAVRKRAPGLTASAQLAIAGGVALYIAGCRDWATHLSHPVDRKTNLSEMASIDAGGRLAPPVPDHFACKDRGTFPMHTNFEDWHSDCSFSSGLIFAKPQSRCVSFTFSSGGSAWSAADDDALAGLRANADSDPLVTCGPPSIQGASRRVTMCEPHRPAYLLDGLRLYALASLDDKLVPMDRLKLMRIDSAPACH